MLKSLRIENFILVERAQIDFETGFTVISGETGSGKSVIIKALRLVLGEKSSKETVRKGTKQAVVEAAFDISQLSDVKAQLARAGIDHPDDELLLLRRIVSENGQSRTYINNTMAHKSTLAALSHSLLDFVGQHASTRLFDLTYHRDVVDLFGGIDVTEFQAAYRSWIEATRRLEAIHANEAERHRRQATLDREIEEIETASIKEGEAESLYEEFVSLTHASEWIEKSDQIQTLCEEACAKLRQAENIINTLTTLDVTLGPALAEADEVAFQVTRFKEGLECDPQRLEIVDSRMREIQRLNKRYGDCLSYLAAAQTERTTLMSEAESTDLLEKQVAHLEAVVAGLADRLSQARRSQSVKLEEALSQGVAPLNMEGAKFDIQVTTGPLHENGADTVAIHFAPNVGEKMVPLRECASGGELSRILLALKTILAGLEMTPTLIFDEIDANIGGQTAVLVASKLAHIADKRQVVCITHLPQVASRGDHHIQVAKRTMAGRTTTSVKCLSSQGIQEELSRMAGTQTLLV